MKLRRTAVLMLSGMSWIGIGIFLLTKGFKLLLLPQEPGSCLLFLHRVEMLIGRKEQAALIVVCLGLIIGFFKSRTVLRKAAMRIINRIEALPNPCPVSSIYPRSYLFLLLGMMTMGIALKWIPMYTDLKGLVDIAVGSALTNASAFYFRHCMVPTKAVSK